MDLIKIGKYIAEKRKALGLTQKQLAEQMGTKVFSTTIREFVKTKEAQEQKKLLVDYAPKCTSMQDYFSFAKELTGLRKL